MSHVLAIDIGGTKTLVSLIDGSTVVDSKIAQTPASASANEWCDLVASLSRKLNGVWNSAGAAVTGVVRDGRWSALNSATLNVPDNFPLAIELKRRLGVPVVCMNDAMAAAWGEYRYGAGEREDLFFVTISTGIGGGAVIHGRLQQGWHGVAGSVGSLRAGASLRAARMEDVSAGRWMAERAAEQGYPMDARGVFSAATQHQQWALDIVRTASDAVATLLLNVQLVLDPPRIVVGGSIGLASGFIDALKSRLADLPDNLRSEIRPAALGAFAGAIGAADLARNIRQVSGRTR